MLLSSACEGLCLLVTVLLCPAGVPVSTGVKGPVLAPWLAITSATPRPGLCPREQLPWSEGNNHLLCARVCGQAAGAEGWTGGQCSPRRFRTPCFWLVPESRLLPTTHSPRPTLPRLGYLGPASGGLAGATGPQQSGRESSPS